MNSKLDFSLMLVTTEHTQLFDIVSEAVLGGVSVVQFRDKISSDENFLKIALKLKALLAQYKIPLLINDRVDIALKINAEGVHIGQGDMPYHEARRILGPDKIIGLSVETLEQAALAESYDVDYLGVSPIFLTESKPDLKKEWGLEGLKRLRELSRHKLIAIGGINSSNISSLIQSGADGIAVVSEIFKSKNPRESAKTLRLSLSHEKRNFQPQRVLTVACSDSGGGAGVEADLKTFSALGCYGMTCFTGLSAQNTVTVKEVFEVPSKFVRKQLETVLDDIGVDALKIGVIPGIESIKVLADILKQYAIKNVVLDTVMISKSGHKFIQDSTIAAMKQYLFPLTKLITPNLPEACELLQRSLHSQEDIIKAGRALLELGPEHILIKGGHKEGPLCTDFLFYKKNGNLCVEEFESRRVFTENTHGTGCTLSAAITSFLSKGLSVSAAVSEAKNYLGEAIAAGQYFKIGRGHGPVHHFHFGW